MVDPRTAHLIDARVLFSLLPNVNQADLWTIRQAFARYLSTRRAQRAETWQEAWNQWSGATSGRLGNIEYRTPRCRECKGRGFETRRMARNLARTGSPVVCGECHGSRRGSLVRQPARHATLPENTPDATRADPHDSETHR